MALGDLFVRLGLQADDYFSGVKAIQRSAGELERSVKPLGKTFADLGSAATKAGTALTAAFTLPLAAIGTLSVKAASDFESSFAGVRKTVDATEEEFAKLSQGFRDMAREIPVSVNELNRIGEAAGQLGIAKDDILDFSRAMADLGATTNLTAEEAATATAQIQNIFGAAGKDVDRFASTLVALGNAGASTEKDIIEMGKRIAGAGQQIGLSQAQVLSFASALSSIGINAEAGGGAISRVFLKINDAVASGGAGLAEFARIANRSTADFKKDFETNAATATAAFIAGLSRLKDAGENVNATLEKVVGKNIVLKDTLLRAAGAGQLLTDQITLGDRAWLENTAAVKEAAQRYSTFESQFKVFRNQLSDVAIELGTAMLPALKSLLDSSRPLIAALGELAKSFAALPSSVQVFTIGLAALTAAIGPVLAGLGLMTSGLGSLIPIFAKAGSILSSAGGLVPALAALAGPAGAIALAAAAVGAAVIVFNQWQKATEDVTSRLNNLKKAMDDTRTAAQLMGEISAKAANGGKVSIDEFNVAMERARKEAEAAANQLKGQAVVADGLAGSMDKVRVSMSVTATATDELAKSGKKVAASLSEIDDASEEQKKAIDGLIASVRKEITESATLIAALKKLEASHVSAGAIIAGLGAQIQATVAALEAEGRAIDPTLKKWSEYITTQARLKTDMEDRFNAFLVFDERQREQKILLDELNQSWDEYIRRGNPVIAMNLSIADSFKQAKDAAIAASAEFQRTLDIRRLDVGLRPVAPEIGRIEIDPAIAREAAETQRKIDKIKEGAAGIKHTFEDIRSSAGKIFDDMLIRGENVFSSLKNLLKGGALSLGRTIFQDISEALLGPIHKAFTDFFRDTIGGLLKKALGGITSAVGVVFSNAVGGAGAAATGAAAGGLGGGLTAAKIGALATNPVTIAVAGAIGTAVAVIKSQAHWEANKLRETVHDPFVASIREIHDAFFAAAEAGTLTSDAAKAARDDLANVWDQFKAAAEAFAAGGSDQALVVEQMFARIKEVWGEDLSSIFTGMENAIASLRDADISSALKEQVNSIKELVAGTELQASALAMESALADLIESGMEWGPIVAALGLDITGMADKMRALGLTVPPYVQAIADQITANQELVQSLERLGDVERELSSTRDELVGAVIGKLDFIDREIEQSEASIQGWKSEIESINERITDNQFALADAKHWQDLYTSSIRDAQQEFERATSRRASLEQQIARLEVQTQRDKLVAALDSAKASSQFADVMIKTIASGITKQGSAWTSVTTTMQQSVSGSIGSIEAAQKALDVFDAEQKRLEVESRVQQLANLKNELAQTIIQQGVARTAFEQSKMAADELIAKEKERLDAQIAADFELRKSLGDKIRAEQDHIASMEAERVATEALFDAINEVRQTELEKIDDTIQAIIDRGKALEDERNALESITALSTQVADFFSNLSVPQQQQIGPGTAILGSFQSGTDYVPQTGAYMLHRGESVSAANESNVSLNIDNIVINGGKGNENDARALLDTLARLVEQRGYRLVSSHLQR